MDDIREVQFEIYPTGFIKWYLNTDGQCLNDIINVNYELEADGSFLIWFMIIDGIFTYKYDSTVGLIQTEDKISIAILEYLSDLNIETFYH